MYLVKLINKLFSTKEVDEFDFEKERNLTDLDGEDFIYKGETIDDVPNGFGEAKFEGGDIYIGYFKGGMRHGVGMYRWISGDYHVGDWVNNERKGFGINYIKLHENVVYGEFDGLRLVNSEGAYTKQINSSYCVICGKYKKHVKLLLSGGITDRAICDTCTFLAVKTLKTEMNYSDAELLELITGK